MTNTMKWTRDVLGVISVLGGILYGVFVYMAKIDDLDERLHAIEDPEHVDATGRQGVANLKVHLTTLHDRVESQERRIVKLEEKSDHNLGPDDPPEGTPSIEIPNSKLVLTPTWFTPTSPIWILNHQVAVICTGGFGDYRGRNYAKFRVTDSKDGALTANHNPKTLREGEFVNFSYRKMGYRLDLLDLTPEDQKAQVRVVELGPEP